MALSSTSFQRKWRSGKTTVVRVPKVMATRLLEIARRWDEAGDLRVREEDGVMLIETPRKPVKYDTKKQVNVATVPQRSPFRYPGGKTWLVPQLRCWLLSKRSIPARFIEPFAGGAIASMTVGFERLAKHVIFAEVDAAVAAVWRVVLNGEAEWLARRILSFQVTAQNVERTLEVKPESLREQAFQTVLRNRMQRGGIMAKGAGLIKVGENGKGLLSRWYAQTLATRIREINRRKDRFSFLAADGFALISEHLSDKEAVFYFDPPYTVAARRLYSHWDVDHARLFALAADVKGDFLMSYDDTDEVRELAKKHGFSVRQIAMKNTHHTEQRELLIGRDLSWVEP
jgi:DNA adenine methylase